MTRSSHMGTKSPHTGKHREKLLDCEEAGVSYRCSIQLQVGSLDVKHILAGADQAEAALTQIVYPSKAWLHFRQRNLVAMVSFHSVNF